MNVTKFHHLWQLNNWAKRNRPPRRTARKPTRTHQTRANQNSIFINHKMYPQFSIFLFISAFLRKICNIKSKFSLAKQKKSLNFNPFNFRSYQVFFQMKQNVFTYFFLYEGAGQMATGQLVRVLLQWATCCSYKYF